MTAPSADGLPEEGEEEATASSAALADSKKEETGKEEETPKAGLFSRLGNAVSAAFGGGVTAPSADGLPEEGEEEATASSAALADSKKEETGKEEETPKAGLFSRLGNIVSGAFGGGVTAPSADGLPEEGEEEATASSAALADSKKEETGKEEETPKADLFSRLGNAVNGAFDAVITPSGEALPEKGKEGELSSSALADSKKEETDKEAEAPKAGLFSRLGNAVNGAFDAVITPSGEALPEKGKEGELSSSALAGGEKKDGALQSAGLFDSLGRAVSEAFDAVITPFGEALPGFSSQKQGDKEGSSDLQIDTSSALSVNAAEQGKGNLAYETGLDVEERKQLELEKELKPIPYFVLTVDGGRQIWGTELTFVGGRYLRVRLASTFFLIRPEKFRSIRAITIKGRNTASISPHYMVLLHGEEDDKKSLVLSNITAKEDEDGQAEGFLHQDELIEFEDIISINVSGL